jgi:tripartite-type tricarboxylate transporter receptor subunit TctC
MRRSFLLAMALGLVLAFDGQAQQFPARPVKVVIPYQPGGGTDILVRALATEASQSLGQPIVIDNRPGGASMIGTQLVVDAAPDGYTILAMDSAILVNPGLFGAKLPYDTIRQLTGITMLASGPVPLLVNPAVPAPDLAALVALAKARPGTLNFASGGNGSAPHLAGELFKLVAGIDIIHVPYKGTAPGLADLLAGSVQMMFGGISSSRQFVEAGRLRAVAMSATRRSDIMPTVPTFEEAGLKGVNAESYWGLYAPAGTPPAILKTLNEHFVRALKEPRIASQLRELGFETIANAPDEHSRQLAKLVAEWTQTIHKAGIKIE